MSGARTGERVQGPALSFTIPAGRPWQAEFCGGGLALDLGEGSSLEHAIEHDFRPLVISRRCEALEAQEEYEVQYPVRRVGRARMWLLEQGRFTGSGQGPDGELHGVLVDITRTRRAVGLLQEDLDDSLVQRLAMSRRDRARETFVRLFAHDVDPLLRQGHQVLDDLAERVLCEEPVEVLRRVWSEVSDMVATVLAPDRFVGTECGLRLEEVDLADVAASAVRELDAQIDTRLASAPVRVDARLMRQAIRNLSRNAIVHTPSGAQVTVRTLQEGDKAEVHVIDDGGGVPDEDKETVFDPYIRLVGPDQPGMGMGLSLVRAITELHGGTCSIVDTPGGGATFRLHLPLSAAVADVPHLGTVTHRPRMYA